MLHLMFASKPSFDDFMVAACIARKRDVPTSSVALHIRGATAYTGAHLLIGETPVPRHSTRLCEEGVKYGFIPHPLMTQMSIQQHEEYALVKSPYVQSLIWLTNNLFRDTDPAQAQHLCHWLFEVTRDMVDVLMDHPAGAVYVRLHDAFMTEAGEQGRPMQDLDNRALERACKRIQDFDIKRFRRISGSQGFPLFGTLSGSVYAKSIKDPERDLQAYSKEGREYFTALKEKQALAVQHMYQRISDQDGVLLLRVGKGHASTIVAMLHVKSDFDQGLMFRETGVTIVLSRDNRDGTERFNIAAKNGHKAAQRTVRHMHETMSHDTTTWDLHMYDVRDETRLSCTLLHPGKDAKPVFEGLAQTLAETAKRI